MKCHIKYEQALDKLLFSMPFIEQLSEKHLMIAGATGMIGSTIVDCLMRANEKYGYGIHIIALGRSEEKARERFKEYFENVRFCFKSCDVNKELEELGDCDFLIHAASNTHPVAYSKDPIGTITANVIGTYNLLEYAVHHKVKRFIFLSSVEIYGENCGGIDKFTESYSGYIDCNTVRAGYPESKRTGESLCCAYAKQYGMDIIIPRLCRIYGPTMDWGDSKAVSQFIKKSVLGEDIILKSDGKQLYSYLVVFDAVSAILKLMLEGDSGEAYNISSENSDVYLKNLAEKLADIAHTKVIFESPDEVERMGFSTATKALLDNSKLKKTGWRELYSLQQGLELTVELLRDKYKSKV